MRWYCCPGGDWAGMVKETFGVEALFKDGFVTPGNSWNHQLKRKESPSGSEEAEASKRSVALA